jgi:hypothetical protein
VQGLDHGAAFGARRVVDRGRDQRQEVVDVDDVVALLAQARPDRQIRTLRPHGLERGAQVALPLDAAIIVLVGLDLHAGGEQQALLGFEAFVFAASNLVAAMDHQDPHGRSLGLGRHRYWSTRVPPPG